VQNFVAFIGNQEVASNPKTVCVDCKNDSKILRLKWPFLGHFRRNILQDYRKSTSGRLQVYFKPSGVAVTPMSTY